MPSKRSGARLKMQHTSMRLALLVLMIRRTKPGVMKVTGALFQEILEEALVAIFGVIGGAMPTDLIEFDDKNCIATICCRKSDEDRIWAASTFMTQFAGHPCRLQVVEASPELCQAFKKKKLLEEI